VALAHCWSNTAHADFGGSLGWVSVGGNLGVSSHGGEAYGIWGAEVSMGQLHTLAWGGAYLDAVYDVGTDRVRFSFGPELGLLCFGVDGGLLLDVGEGQVRHGFVVRPMLAARWVFPYVRFGAVSGDDPYNFSEVGVLLKYPFVD
jgi:hypothetical protein